VCCAKYQKAKTVEENEYFKETLRYLHGEKRFKSEMDIVKILKQSRAT
jgi:hypothetical protein